MHWQSRDSSHQEIEWEMKLQQMDRRLDWYRKSWSMCTSFICNQRSNVKLTTGGNQQLRTSWKLQEVTPVPGIRIPGCLRLQLPSQNWEQLFLFGYLGNKEAHRPIPRESYHIFLIKLNKDLFIGKSLASVGGSTSLSYTFFRHLQARHDVLSQAFSASIDLIIVDTVLSLNAQKKVYFNLIQFKVVYRAPISQAKLSSPYYVKCRTAEASLIRIYWS